MSRRPLLLALGLAVACADGFAPSAAPMGALPEYQQWWQATQACSGRVGDLARIQFSVVPGSSFDCPTGRCVGRWEPPATIYLAESHVRNELVVRHEMLHVLIGRPGHPDDLFRTACGLTWDSWHGTPTVPTFGAHAD